MKIAKICKKSQIARNKFNCILISLETTTSNFQWHTSDFIVCQIRLIKVGQKIFNRNDLSKRFYTHTNYHKIEAGPHWGEVSPEAESHPLEQHLDGEEDGEDHVHNLEISPKICCLLKKFVRIEWNILSVNS